MLQEIKCVLIVLLLFIPFLCTCGNFLYKVELQASWIDWGCGGKALGVEL